MNSLIEALNHWGEHYLSFAWPMLWQSNVLIAVLFALDFALRRKVRAAVRYALWLVVLFKLFLPPSLALPTSLAWWIRPVAVAAAPATRPAPAFKVTYGEPALSPAPPLAQAAIAFTPPPSRLTSHALALFGAAIVSLGLLGWMLLRWCQVGRTVRQTTPASDALAHLLDEAKLRAGLRREVHLRLTDTPMSPAVCGLFRPVVLLPRSLVTRLAPEQLRAVLLHELIHLRRGDVWVNCAQTLLQIVYWWHPLLWLANARIRRVREEAVDDAVMLALADERDAYAPTLLEVARLAFHRPSASLGLVGILESRSALRQRIERLVNFQAPRKAGLSVASVLGIAAFAALAAPMGAGKNPSRFGQSALPLHIFQIDRIAFATNLAARAGLPSINLNSGVSITSPSQPGANRLPLLPGQSTRPEDPDLAQKALLRILAAEGLKVEPSEVHLSMVGGSVLVCTGPDKLDSVTRVLTQLNSGPLTDSFSAIRTPPARLQAPASTEATVSRANENEAARKSSSEAVVHKTFVIQIRDDGTYWEQTNQLDFSKVANRLLALSPSNSSVQIICWPKAPVSAFKPIDSIVRGLGITPIFEVLSKPEIPTPETLYLHVIKVDSSFVWQTLINDGSNHAGSSSSDTKAVVRDRANANVRRFFLSRGLDLATSPKSIVLDEYAHALIVRATLDDFSFVEKTLQELNKPPPQVKIEAKFIEMQSEPDWGVTLTNVTANLQEIRAALAQTPPPQSETNSTSSVAYLAGILTRPQLRAALQAVEKKDGTDIISAPTVTTLSDRRARIEATDVKTILKSVNAKALDQPGVISTNGVAPIFNTDEDHFGPVLDVNVTVAEGGMTMEVTALANVKEWLGYNESAKEELVQVYVDGKTQHVKPPHPQIRSRTLATKMQLRDGETLVLGGVSQATLTTLTALTNKVPVLGDLPMFGRLFRSQSTNQQTKTLYLLITPTIMDPAGNPIHSDADLPARTNSIPAQNTAAPR